jgi:CcmD family protein
MTVFKRGFSTAKSVVFRSLLLLFLVTLGNCVFAQEEKGVMASEGKIYVVMAVVIVILIGLFLYLISLDRRIRKMEKKN